MDLESKGLCSSSVSLTSASCLRPTEPGGKLVLNTKPYTLRAGKVDVQQEDIRGQGREKHVHNDHALGRRYSLPIVPDSTQTFRAYVKQGGPKGQSRVLGRLALTFPEGVTSVLPQSSALLASSG